MKTYFILFSLLLFSFIQTGKSSNRLTSREMFPCKIGYHWVYKFTGNGSSNGSQYDSITVDIVGQCKLHDGQNAKIWVFKYPNGVDTNYVESNGKTVIIFNNYREHSNRENSMPMERMRYVFPLSKGREWVLGYEYADTIKVIAEGSITVPYGHLPSTYTLVNVRNSAHFIGNYRKIDTIWFTPLIGVSRLYKNEFQMKQELGNGAWELKAFSLK